MRIWKFSFEVPAIVFAQDLARDIDVFAPRLLRLDNRVLERAIAAHAGELDQHGQIQSGDHFDVAVFRETK